MSILSGEEIKRRVVLGDISISNFNESRLNPNSYNLRLGNELVYYLDETLDCKYANPSTMIIIPEQGMLLQPGKLYLGRTVETTFSRTLVPMIEGRSSLGRLGLFVHVSAGFGDIGFCGTWTLELTCVQPIWIRPGIDICQIYFHEIIGDYKSYDGKYQNQVLPLTSGMYTEFKED